MTIESMTAVLRHYMRSRGICLAREGGERLDPVSESFELGEIADLLEDATSAPFDGEEEVTREMSREQISELCAAAA